MSNRKVGRILIDKTIYTYDDEYQSRVKNLHKYKEFRFGKYYNKKRRLIFQTPWPSQVNCVNDNTTFFVKMETPRYKTQGIMRRYMEKGILQDPRTSMPVNGRFLAPDPYIQDLSNLQSHNPYAYCLNNPFRYTDPTGCINEDGNDDWNIDLYDLISNMDALFSGGIYGGMLDEVVVTGKRTESLEEWGEKQEKSEEFERGLYNNQIRLEDNDRILVDNDNLNDGARQGDVKQGFDISKAVDYINANAHRKSQGACSKYVQKALVAGGIKAAENQPVKAGGAYGPLLTRWGFTMITTTLENYTPVKGDIGVIQGYPSGTPCAAGPCGHIQMYNGNQWVSDYLQSTNRPFYPSPTYQQNEPAFEIYRW